MLVFFTLLGVLAFSDASVIQSGSCDESIAVSSNFDVTQFLGTWYEISRTPNDFENGDCTTVTFSADTAGTLSTVITGVANNFAEELTGTATYGTEAAKLQISLTNGNTVNYWVIDTDYTSYAWVYSCQNVGENREINAWKLSRTASYPNELIPAYINTAISNTIGINPTTDMVDLDNSETACYILPVITSGEPVIISGQCDTNIAIVQNFDVARFLGRWHEIASYASENAEGECSKALYSLNDDGTVKVDNSQVVNQTQEVISGFAVVASTDGSARLTVTLEILPGVTADQELLILATDYDNYAVSYTCVNIDATQKRVYSWIVSRTTELSATVSAAVDTVVNSYLDLNYEYFINSDQSEEACFYYPEYVQGQAVVFPGTCDLTIPAVANFDAARYLGLWHEIEAYPSAFQQDSTCNNAFYSLTDVVDVYNTQVQNQTLDEIYGYAVVASTDGTAKLDVTFPVDGNPDITVTISYWVLATDYDTYSLVYTCEPLGEDTRGVWSWKLSRTKTLPAQAATVIDNIVNSIDVLDDRYYETTDQSEEGCFYYPEAKVGEPVVFPGQCDETIQAVSNFNLAQFSGTWFEIEAYPKEEQPGECVTHDFTVAGTTGYTLASNQVADQFLIESSSAVTYTSTDGSGKFSISFVSNGTTITIPYWIIATDYTDYALAYSCVNRDTDFRAIYSWKLSRSQALSASAQTAINNAIEPIVVLGNEYFETIDQSEDACFYLPNLTLEEPVILPGTCDSTILGMANFDPTRYVGKWYDIESYYDQYQQGSCNDALYTLTPAGTVDVYNTQVVDQTLDTINGTAVLASTDGTGKLLVTFPIVGTDFTIDAEYWILDTDYDSYSLVYSCRDLNDGTQQVTSWKLSRTRSLTTAANTAINTVIDSIRVLNQRFYVAKDHSEQGCFYYPEYVQGQAVVFPGTCDLTIPAVANFDAARYLGLWHEIEAYPSAFQQDSTCNNAFYSLTDVVDVYNTQVQNQTLDEIYGYAVVASTDGTAKLDVTFPVDGNPDITVTISYWVLATDYDTYSLVYTCEPLGEDTRGVWSWKLSRTKTLPAQAATVIDNIVNSIDVLDDRYYETTDQSEEGCFYYPEAKAGEPVVFPGQCDETIQAVSNFNLAQFSGTWFEIEAYPKEEQPGECVTHDFTVAGTTGYTLASNQVADQFLIESSSAVTYTSTDGSGKFSISFVSNGTTITIPYWIIATDYTDYALAYSCVNRDTDFRAIYSWKLSRSQALSAAAQTAINNAIEPIVVLGNEYFETIDQSEDACFYLPNLTLEEPVIFPGTCDSTITGMANFDPTRYVGKWYDIESYYDQYQQGSCNDALYTLTPAGTVDVYNTQVVDQTLDTINGTAVLASTDGTGKLLVTFPIAGTDFTIDAEYWILDTDYDSYSLVYSCRDLTDGTQQVTTWKLSRTRSLTAAANTAINAVIDSIRVLNERFYITKDHSEEGCFYFPEYTPGEAVVFRGQCDESVVPVQNFDVVGYLGLWYDTASYPQAFQFGTCPTATYTVNADGNVDVYNTQVINQTLDTINGLAVVASTDGSAQLNVTFPIDIGGIFVSVVSPYWVLSTDYTSYALVYSCVNVDDESYTVTSWKLSRQPTLLAAGNTAINAVTAGIKVLDDRYYQTQDQSDEGCFYFPEPVAGQPVVFPGSCDETIATVNNFNLANFQGEWYEIASYPKDEVGAGGQCVNYNFTVSGTSAFSLITSQVTDEFLEVNVANVVQSSNDGTAKFTITVNSAGTEVVIPYWILATDYTSYALAYSCVNLENNFRGVYSWKLSRTSQLTEAATTAISQVIATNVVLAEEYFETVDQSEEACFYLPDIPAGESVVFPGQCNENLSVMQNFDPTQYVGRWYDIESYYDDYQQGTCNDALYTLTPEGIVDVYNTQVVDETLDTINGTAVLATTDGSGKLLVTFPIVGTDLTITTSYWILDTDYVSYSLVYSCNNPTPDTRRIYSWKLSRTRQLTAAANTAINAVIDTVDVLNDRFYITRNHSDAGCFYYPEINDGQAVFFRGQCDETVQAVQNFDAVAYMGYWYDVGSYPQEFQFGTCPTATYTLNDGGFVEVFNTQVINQTLDSIDGTAVVASTDGSAKLTVTFPIAGTNFTIDSPYWVLATDYVDYALVYSCLNIDAETRRVTSWKLSRTPTLSTAAQTVINNVVDSVQVLDERYYIGQSHTDEACFYYPVPQAGVPVVFPGTCDESIAVVPNFNFAGFEGTWFEVSAYPKIQQSGECVNYNFTTATATSYNLITNQVVNNFLEISSANVVSSTTDGSAKFNILLTDDSGNAITIPYWIIATDYDNYALAYSCVNLENNMRGVYSWKLSREPTLSTASQTAIAQTIDTIEVLGEEYFETTDQSNSGCFYLPDIAVGEPVVFPGQCDDNIPVVQNFDPTRYVGRWYDIESYYDEYQDGTCNDAQYTLTPEGIVDVYNTQVIDETLDFIYGTAVLASTDGSGKLLVTFPVDGTDVTITTEYWILATDYVSYSFVYSCRNLTTSTKRVYSWKLSRTQQLFNNSVEAINTVINSVDVLNQNFYVQRDHTSEGCFYYPEAVSGQTVTFRGQCNESVLPVQNFDVAGYLGTWYEIEKYPQQFQGGSCPTATYSLNDNGTVDVLNTQVLNQQLDITNLTAAVDSTDGSAKLIVTLDQNINGLTVSFRSPYWVMATDYNNYALVYSCVNNGASAYTIASWKLSRTAALSTASETAINTAMASIKELDQRYYETSSQNADDCFFYPENYGGPVYLEGQCNTPQDVVSNFDTSLFSGTWYDIARFPSEVNAGECASQEFVLNNQQFNINVSGITNERYVTLTGTGTASSDGSGVITATLSTLTGGSQTLTMYVHETDYNSYALISGCRAVDATTKQVYSWKLSRTQSELPTAANEIFDSIITNNDDLFEGYYESTDQTNNGCFYYPVFEDTSASIILPGSCDESIQAISNFSAADYLGLWYEIARYPQTWEDGECARAEYSLGNGVVDVFNTIVFNETLGVQEGYAVVASTDGSGLLEVTFDVNGVTNVANYYVLATDYISYSLVYSCRNLDDGTRQVSSWKLSRTKTLSAEASAIMDPIIVQTQGLIEDYYQTTSQSDDDCFYVPEVNVNEPVIFRGQCEDISGMQGFNVQNYLGWWHEIEHYPTGADTGSCISTDLQASGNSYIAIDTSVSGTSATVSTNAVEVLSEGIIRRTVNNQTIDTYVLATDYNTYSLLYSCVNIDSEHRRVWSGKHSKSRTLTQAAETAMSSAINNNRVLYNQFYISVDQSDEACFHYPELSGQQVILPGQCDDNIPVQQNFNAIEYSGTWYQIERYPQIHEVAGATCTGARYTVNEDTGIVDVLNWEIIDGELETIEGTAELTSTDGSAKLIVELPVRESETGETVTTNLYVLTTDYVSYSLAYSCENVDSFTRAVGVWKLSRTRTMPAAGTTAINTVISQRDELYQPYFIQVTQDEDCDEPSSAYLAKSSMLILLICMLGQLLL